MSLPTRRPARIRILRPAPLVGCGEAVPKRTVGEAVDVSADVLSDGHETLVAIARWKSSTATRWSEAPMHRVDAEADGIRWAGHFEVDQLGEWRWQVEAWADRLATWRDEMRRKVAFGQTELSGELSEGEALLARAAARAAGDDRAIIEAAAAVVSDREVVATARVETALDPDVTAACDRNPDRSEAVRSAPATIDVDPALARFGAWYELFPRSWGGLRGVRTQLPRLADLGFDVLYLPPIHPIGRTNRKGRNNALVAGPDDPGSPWAIGDQTGGHTTVHQELGTIDDVEALVAAARELGIEIALDFAIQCSADHPWLTEHPDWFNRRPDGTLKYAENPPKKYQDIYNVNFDSDSWAELWEALRDVVRFWVGVGVRVFRVDNPHTKPLAFWEWLIGEIRREQPDVIFLAEAFTRRPMMQALARAGFNQSYTYFTWKQARWELTEYVSELALSDEREYFRPNFFVNTPDILTEELQHGGLPKFRARLILAATLSPSYGIYSGFEQGEHLAAGPGSEEYLDSEKFEVKARSLDGPLLPLVATLNRIRREHRALQHLSNIRFLDTENEHLIAYAKSTGGDTILGVVNIDPWSAQTGSTVVPADLGLPPVFEVRDLLTEERFTWHTGHNYV
ncbi:MAG: DUF3416 domain-containing protein, partial [Actinomycetota bacterium]|nr:DUF3416 domain-containing protein [Actinomycetota bacterium]